MLERIRVWTDSSNFVHYELINESGMFLAHSSMPESEWNQLRQNMIDSIRKIEPVHSPIQLEAIEPLLNYLVVLADLAEAC